MFCIASLATSSVSLHGQQGSQSRREIRKRILVACHSKFRQSITETTRRLAWQRQLLNLDFCDLLLEKGIPDVVPMQNERILRVKFMQSALGGGKQWFFQSLASIVPGNFCLYRCTDHCGQVTFKHLIYLHFPCFIVPNGPGNVQTYDLPRLNIWSTTFKHMIYLPQKSCRNKRFLVDHMFKRCFGPKKIIKKGVARERLNIWSTYPSHSAERSVFGQKMAVYDLPAFAPPQKGGRS